MNFNYAALKRNLKQKYIAQLSDRVIDDLLTFEQGLMKDGFPQKRLIISRVFFTGSKDELPFSFDRPFNEGINLVLADNLKGKSSLFKIIKYALTGDNDLAKDVKGWLKTIYVQFKINTSVLTAYLNLEKPRTQATLFNLPIDEIIDQEIDAANIIYQADNEKTYRDYIQDYFFREFDYYHLNWTQKTSLKDRNELVEAKASWNTYFESIYLASRDSYKLAYGSQEELIFQMMIGLKLTYPINRLKVKLEMSQFEKAKLRDAVTAEGRRKEQNKKALEKELAAINKAIERLTKIEDQNVNLSDLYNQRASLAMQIAERNKSLTNYEHQKVQITRNGSKLYFENQERTVQIRKYKDQIQKAQKNKTDLEEHVQFGIFFSNLDIKICPHCSTTVSEEKKTNERTTNTCRLCTHSLDEAPAIDRSAYDQKIESLTAEIAGYEKQIAILSGSIDEVSKELEEIKKKNQAYVSSIREITKQNQTDQKALRDIEANIQRVNQSAKKAEQMLEMEKKKAVAEFRMKEFSNQTIHPSEIEIKEYDIRIALLNEALAELKKERTIQNKEVLGNFTNLMMEELRDMGVMGITEIGLTETFKVMYNQNNHWVSFDEISEGEQLRVKIAFYLSIIQSDIKYSAGKHPRLLIIDSPNKEEGDKVYREGLKKVLNNIANKYGNQLQIIIGTASRELEDSVAGENAWVLPEGQFLF